nr:hypothetical protein [Tanacetum cinerariifolium]
TGADETKNLKKTNQAPKGISVGPKKGVDSTNKVSDSNPFVVLSSFDNDVEIEYPSDHDSKDEVASVNNDMARNLASERTRFGTQSLLEKWRDSYGNGDYDEDPWDDDMYEGQDLSE